MTEIIKDNNIYNLKKYLKKIFIGYLILITGCTSPLQNVENNATVENNKSSKSEQNYITQKSEKTRDRAVENYKLPTLDLKNEKVVTTKDSKNSLFEGVGANSDYQPIANPRNGGLRTQDGSDLQALAMGIANTETSEAVKNWFALKRATAELSLGIAENGVKTGSFDVLMPLYDNEKDLFFTQLGFRRSNQFTEDYRNTINAGLGFRHINESNWLLGINSFYDRDLTGKNDRIGLGLEAMTDYLKITGNSYIRLSDWKDSPDMDYYQERPANGWDVRTEAYLPQYPQLGGKLMYEQYYGNDVGLFGSSSRQKDPSATTIGLLYTPIPLISLSTDYRQGQNGLSETSFKVGFNLQLGVPLKKQLSPDEIRASRLLGNARYDLVDRRNEIILDYKENEKGSINLPLQIKGSANEIISFPVNISGPVRNITWVGTAASYAMVYGGGTTASVKLPAYNQTSANIYTLKAIAVDSSGRVVESNVMQIGVESKKIILESSKQTAIANGNDFIIYTATLTKTNGEAIQNAELEWNIQDNVTVLQKDTKTNASGQAILKITSIAASNINISVNEVGGISTTTQGNFIIDASSAKVTTVTTTNSTVIADGVTYTTLTAKVTDLAGNPAGAGVIVNWNTDLGTLSNSTSITDDNGNATILLKSGIAGVANITASTAKGTANSQVNYTSNVNTAQVVNVSTSISSLIANGNDSANLSALVKDSNGNIVPAGVLVNWSSNIGTLENATSLTDANGQAFNKFKSTITGTATITATGVNGNSSTQINIIADNNTSKVTNISTSLPQATANGTQVLTLSAEVKDSNGNLVPAGVTVNWSSSIGDLGTTTSVTDNQGIATNTLKSNVAGIINISASTTSNPVSVPVIFIADVTTAKILNLTANTTIVLANGSAYSTIEATIVDANNNPLKEGINVNWTSSSGILSSSTTTTNISGKASVNITSTVAGISNVSASTPNDTKNIGITFTTDNTTAKIISLTETKSIIKANGVDSTTIKAVVKDNNNNIAPNIEVNWSTTSGTLSNNSTITDINGEVSISFTGSVAGVATITASTINGSLDKNITLESDNTTAKVTEVNSSTTQAIADNITIINLEALVKDNNGNIVGAGVIVNWNTTIGSLGNPTSVTNAAGKAINTINSNIVGNATITAGTVNGSTSTNINFTAIPTVAVVNVVATPATIIADGISTTTLVATVKDQNNNLVGSGVTVNWTSSIGTLSTNSSITNNEGEATITLISNISGTANILASATNGNASTTVTINPVLIYKVYSYNSNPSNAVADGLAFVTVTAQIRDQFDNIAPAGIPVIWSTTLGNIVNPNTVTNAQGEVSAQFTSTTAGNAFVSTNISSFDSTINFTTAPSGFVVASLSANPTNIPGDGVTKTTITAIVNDKNGNPVSDGTKVTWSGNIGTLDQNVTTTVGGVATNLYSSNTVGTAQISAVPENGNGNNINVIVNPLSYVVSEVTSSKTTIKGDGIETTTITAKVKDTNGNPAGAGITVMFANDFGINEYFSNTTAVTDASGNASVTFRSDLVFPQIGIYASINGQGQSSTNVEVSANNTYAIDYMFPSAPSVNIDGIDEVTIFALIVDENGNTAPENVKVFFRTLDGQLSSSFAYTNSSGETTVKFKTTNKGNLSITAIVAGNNSIADTTVVGEDGRYSNGVVFMSISIPDNKLYNNKSSNMTVKIQDRDTFDAVPNKKISFECIAGPCLDQNGNSILKQNELTTDSLGNVRVAIGPSTNYGVATIRVTYVEDPSMYANYTVDITSDPEPN